MSTRNALSATPHNVVDLQEFKGSRPMSQGSPKVAVEEGKVREGGDRQTDIQTSAVNSWIQRILLGLVGVFFTIATAYFTWSIPAINNIGTAVQLFVQEQAYAKQEISKLNDGNAEIKRAVDNLMIQANTWATKDQLQTNREVLLQRIDSVQTELNDLKIKVTRMEAENSKPARR